MTSTDIWIVFTKCHPLPGCDVDFDDCEFYFSEVFVPTSDSGDLLNTFEEILGKVRNGLLDKKFELIDVSKIIRFDQKQWEVIGDSGNDVIAHAKESASINEIVFSGFRSKEIEDETQYKHIISNLD
ncbi:hypothetical protein [Microbulbifer sp. ALW1]|uniref:hypothetical protein n=1 Tax=Microbulbifer sp. (strain ALW1) TaxID=1516059 RepID=UPI0013578F07|nr:hypothetical protein [Microbulbifer sp. ALW1]